MIASSARIKLLAGGTALLAHAAFAVVVSPTPEVRMEGGAGAPEARLGTSFADMVSGTLTSETATESLAPIKAPAPEAVDQLQPTPAAKPAKAIAPAPAPDSDAAPAPTPQPLAALAPETASPAAQPDSATVPRAPEAQSTITEEAEAVGRSLRPVRRSEEFERRNAPMAAAKRPAPPEPAKPEAQPAPRGNAETNATAGSARGSDAAPAKSQGTDRGQSTAAGTAAASNYPGLVMRKISSVRKPRMSRSGSARVSFSVAASGALAGASIARSSGRSDLDREALRLIQRAAPFPAPPASAQRSFSIDIEFR